MMVDSNEAIVDEFAATCRAPQLQPVDAVLHRYDAVDVDNALDE